MMRSGPADIMQVPRTSVPRVSVVVPTYNYAWLIEDTILSLRHQTFADLEIIVVDDGSTDDIAEVMAPHLAADPRVRLVRQQNRGLAGARNRGLAEAESEFVGFIDADDIWHPEFLEKTVAALDDNPDAPFAFAYSFRFDLDNEISGMPGWKRPPRHDFKGMLTLNVVGNGSAALFRRDRVNAVGGYDETLRTRDAQGAEDWKLCIQLSARAAPILIPKPLVGYRYVAGGMSQGNPARQMRAVRAVMDDIAAEFPEVPRKEFADGQVTMNGWLLGAFLRKHMYGTGAWMMVQSYILNPLWFTNRSLRDLHRMTVKNWLTNLRHLFLRDAPARTRLTELQEDDRRPFAFLSMNTRPRVPPR